MNSKPKTRNRDQQITLHHMRTAKRQEFLSTGLEVFTALPIVGIHRDFRRDRACDRAQPAEHVLDIFRKWMFAVREQIGDRVVAWTDAHIADSFVQVTGSGHNTGDYLHPRGAKITTRTALWRTAVDRGRKKIWRGDFADHARVKSIVTRIDQDGFRAGEFTADILVKRDGALAVGRD